MDSNLRGGEILEELCMVTNHQSHNKVELWIYEEGVQYNQVIVTILEQLAHLSRICF